MIIALLACTQEEPATPPPASATEPPTLPWVDTGIYRPADTSDPALTDDVPDHTISVEHLGFWDRSGDPFNAVVGAVHVREVTDGYVPATADTADILACDLSWFITGTPDLIVHTCAGCGPAWELTFTYDPNSVTTRDNCNDNELPREDERWHMAYHPGEDTIYFNYYDTGVWLPWWEGEETGDRIDFGWTGILAIDVPEEEEE